ncbi:hypothetical protein CHUAL_002247 [Chamberlinius hualienensis]
MPFKTMSITAWLSVILIFFISAKHINASNYCCDYDYANVCGWKDDDAATVKFNWSNDNTPDITDITDFSPPAYYMWIQSSGDFIFRSPSISLNENDIISTAFYKQFINSATSLTLTFTSDSTDILILNDTNSGWNSPNATCTRVATTIDQVVCCPVSYPCTGTFQVKGTIASESNDLVAFSDFLINSCPPNSFCNQFESSSDATWDLKDWALSTPVTPLELTYNSSFAYAKNSEGGKLTSPMTLINTGDTLTFQYYVNTDVQDIENSLIVYINDLDSGLFNPIGIYMNTSDSWVLVTFTCTANSPCCTNYPCNGKVVWESSINVGQIFIAVDRLQLNSGCENTASCCKFEENNVCNYKETTDKGQSSGWLWSGNTANADVTAIDGDYVWWQISTTIPIVSTFQSESVTLYKNSTVKASIWSLFAGGQSRLNVNFIDDKGQSSTLDYMTTSIKWFAFSADCVSGHAQCCDNDKGCTGRIEFTVISNSVTTIAIDNIQIGNVCNV